MQRFGETEAVMVELVSAFLALGLSTARAWFLTNVVDGLAGSPGIAGLKFQVD